MVIFLITENAHKKQLEVDSLCQEYLLSYDMPNKEHLHLPSISSSIPSPKLIIL